jgi:uncharacterized protein
MSNSGWSRPESPFHAGELAIHARMGTEAQVDKLGRRLIQESMPEQHQRFFAQLPYAIAGTIDNAGNPWASILVGSPGFLSAQNDRLLQVMAQPLVGDPIVEILKPGIGIGLLGIELHSRRRNRLNGTVTTTQGEGFSVAVRQSFGNCPQYIQARSFEWQRDRGAQAIHQITHFAESEQAMIAAADTFFIATAYQAKSAGAAGGVDVSHRGGKPGFVRVEDNLTLTIPDFSGNCLFNTFGNLEMNPRAGLLFIDFAQGNLLYLTGLAEVIWTGDEILNYAGAERLFRFHLEYGYRVEKSLPLQWSTPEFSPFLDHTGEWQAS